MNQETDNIDDISSDESLLIEYLDGELSLRDRQIVEQRLAEDPNFRETLGRLDETWRYLDLLDRDDTDKDLVETTLETVVFSAEESVLKLQRKNRRRFSLKVLLLSILFLFLFLFSVSFGMRLAPDENFLIRVATPIIDRLDMYLMLQEEDPHLELLRCLAERRVFLPPLPENAPPIDPDAYRPSKNQAMTDSSSIFPSYEEVRRRLRHVENLDGALYNQFYWNFKKFQSFSVEKRLSLLRLHEDIEKSPGRDELYQTLRNLHTWFKSLQSYEKYEIRSKNDSVTERVDRIVRMRKRLEADRETVYTTPPASEILMQQGDADVRTLGRVLGKLDFARLEQTLDTPPDQTISILLQLYSETKNTTDP